jgi:phage/plasmid-associated DNA primase
MYEAEPSLHTHDFAKKIYELANDRFIYKKINSNGDYKLYCYNGNWWERGDLLLSMFISSELYNYYMDLLTNVYFTHPNVKKFKSQINKLKQLHTKQNIIKQYRDFGVKNIEFDNKWWLLGFNNKVLDLQTHEFRNYKFDDYISITTEYEWIEPSEKEVKTVKDIIKKVMPIKDERKLYKQILSTGLEGRCLEKFIVFNGNGRNGKGLTDEFVIMALGSYALYANSSILFETSKTGSNPELANLDKKRFVVFKEPPSKKKFENSIIKELTGGGKISARSHYETNTQKTLHNTIICECNIKPPLAEEPTTADIERIIDIPFRSTFIDDIKIVDEKNYIFKADISLKSDEFRDAHKCALIKILIDAHIKHTKNNFILIIPSDIKRRTQEYLEKNCDLLGWVKEHYEFTKDKKDFIQIKELYDLFRDSEYWYNLTKYEKRKNNYAFFVEYFATNIITKQYYREEHVYVKNNKRTHYRNILIYTKKIDKDINLFIDDDNDDDDE